MRMKYLTGAAAVALLLAGPAVADVTVLGTVDIDKDVDINERIDINNDIDLTVRTVLEAEKFANSSAVANQSNFGNKACSNCAEKEDLIIDSANGNTGVVSMNQAVGNYNNQGTLISVAVDADDIGDPGDPGSPADPAAGGFAESGAHADQRNGSPDALDNGEGYSGPGNEVDTVNVLFRNANIINSYNGNTGLMYGNQASGNMANQVNVLSLAFSLADGGVALSETDLGQVNANNTVAESSSSDDNEFGINKIANISGSLNGNVGIVGVNQSVGNMSNQANVVSVAAVGSSLPTF